MNALFQHAIARKIDLSYFRGKLISELVVSGDTDLLAYFLDEIRVAQLPARLSIPTNPNKHLPLESILCQHRNMFVHLLELGADPDSFYQHPESSSQYALDSAATIFGCDPFYFNELLARGADLSKLKNGGIWALYTLISDPMGAEAVSTTLRKYPYLLHSPFP
jgi:hypothetical protein